MSNYYLRPSTTIRISVSGLLMLGSWYWVSVVGFGELREGVISCYDIWAAPSLSRAACRLQS